MLIVQHNTFFNSSDHFSALIRNEFKGSPFVESSTCGKTKTRAIVNCIGYNCFEKLVGDMKEKPFSIMLLILAHSADTFYWFDKSAKRKNILSGYFELCDMDYENVIKFISMR